MLQSAAVFSTRASAVRKRRCGRASAMLLHRAQLVDALPMRTRLPSSPKAVSRTTERILAVPSRLRSNRFCPRRWIKPVGKWTRRRSSKAKVSKAPATPAALDLPHPVAKFAAPGTESTAPVPNAGVGAPDSDSSSISDCAGRIAPTESPILD